MLARMREAGLSAAKLSDMAGLNKRAVKDIEERRVVSPKISTVFAIAKALNCDPGEMLGLPQRFALNRDLAQFLAQYSQDDQARFLSALSLIPRSPDEMPTRHTLTDND